MSGVTFGFISDSFGGAALMWSFSRSVGDVPVNGGRPVSTSYKVTPRL